MTTLKVCIKCKHIIPIEDKVCRMCGGKEFETLALEDA